MFGTTHLKSLLFKYLMLTMWYRSPPIYHGFPFSAFSPSSLFSTVFPLYSHFSCLLLSCFISNIITVVSFILLLHLSHCLYWFLPFLLLLVFFWLGFYESNTAVFSSFHITVFRHLQQMLFFAVLNIRWLVPSPPFPSAVPSTHSLWLKFPLLIPPYHLLPTERTVLQPVPFTGH